MPINPSDPSVSTALAQALGHPSPFTQAECAALEGPLTVLHARDVSDLQHCTGLRHLELIASDIEDLTPLTALKALRHLTIIATPIVELTPLRELPALEHLTLNFTHATDCTPLIGMPALVRTELLGNPWTKDSLDKLVQQLPTTPAQKTGKPPLVLTSSQRDWKATQMLWDRGIKASISHVDIYWWYLVRAGIPKLTPGPCDAVFSEPGLVMMALKKNPAFGLETLFEHFTKKLAAPPQIEYSRLTSRRPWGSSTDAASWVEASELDTTIKAGLLRFIAHFPTLSFYREPPEFLAAVEKESQFQLPQWLKEIRQTLAWVIPGESERDIQVRFAHFDLPGRENNPAGKYWYSISPGLPSGEPSEGFMSIGISHDPLWSQLLIPIGETENPSIYDFAEEMYRDLRRQGIDPRITLQPVFTSYASMLAAIDAVRVREGEPILAVQEPE